MAAGVAVAQKEEQPPVEVPEELRAQADQEAEARMAAIMGYTGPLELAKPIEEAPTPVAAIGPEAKAAVPVLIESLSSEEREVRGTACYALGKIGPAAAEAVPALQDRLQKVDDAGRTAVIWALLKVRPGDAELEKTAVPLLAKALNHEEELVRLEAASALGGLASAAEASVLARLKELAEKDPSDQVREAAAEAVKKLEGK